MTNSDNIKVPYRQIRATYDSETITVYQAYSECIAKAAVKEQKIYASPDFSFDRMTWIKPSWCWMMYRSGYAAKDSRQTHILALKMTHAHFRRLLEQAVVCRGGIAFTAEEKKRDVRVQWDPERDFRLGQLAYRNLQVGIGRGLSRRWAEEWIESIEDVTEMAVRLRGVVERGEVCGVQELVEIGCLPVERVYDVPADLKRLLSMNGDGEVEV